MKNKLAVSSSPFLRNNTVSTRRLMLDVCIALMPAGLASIWFFGLKALILILVSVLSAMIAEWYFEKKVGRKSTVGDLSAVVTGLLLAYNIPASAPWWVAALGSIIAVILVKQLFGGIGQNFMNPALIGRTILMISFPLLMASHAAAVPGNFLLGLSSNVPDVIAGATPLAENPDTYSLWHMFIGQVPGMLGETSKLALLLGGLYLIFRKVINWRIPLAFIGTVFVLYLLSTGTLYSVDSGSNNVMYQLFSGGLFLGAFFMATDYVTCPVTNKGKWIMGIGCGLILFIIRSYGSYPEGCSFGILFMNVATPLIDKYTVPKVFGEVAE